MGFVSLFIDFKKPQIVRLNFHLHENQLKQPNDYVCVVLFSGRKNAFLFSWSEKGFICNYMLN
jgi:hypothetical protein